MAERIPQSVAKRVVFRAIASADHITPATGKTIAVTISKNGGAFANPAAGATNATEISSGFYYFDLGTGDTGTLGPLAWRAAGTGVDDIGDVLEVANATNGGFSALPAVAAGSNGGVPLVGTQVPNATAGASGGLVIAGSNAATTFATLTSTGAFSIDGTSHVAQTGDSFARIGATGSGLTSLASATNLATVAGYIDTEIADIQSRLPAALVSGRMDVSVGAMASNVVTAAALATDAGAEIAAAVFDLATAGHTTSGTFGAAVVAAGSAGDPWSTSLPGSYGAGTAGFIVGTNIDATMSSRASATSLATVASYVDTEVAAIKAKTDNLPASPAAVGDIPTAIQNADALLARDIGSGSGAGTSEERTVRSALRFLRNKWSIVAGVVTVRKEDDTTAAWTATVSTTPGADPVTGTDPA